MGDALEARFNPVSVHGEISGFSRASSGHCYFALKDEEGQIRCALFKRAASLLSFVPRDGQQVRVRGRLSLYPPRGEVQLVVESLRLDGQGSLFERFMELKNRLQVQGLFDEARKRPLPMLPRAIGVITSLGAAALHDVLTALRRRAPHVPVVVYPASVQGDQSAGELRAALSQAYQRREVDVLLLVRGGGALEDLWSFNDEALARLIVQAPMPVVCGVGHETDFTIADFCSDVRAATPTAAAELAARPQAQWFDLLQSWQDRLMRAQESQLDRLGQRLDGLASRLGRPSQAVTRAQSGLTLTAARLRQSAALTLQRQQTHLERISQELPRQLGQALAERSRQVETLATRLHLLDPQLVLARGYAWLADEQGQPVTAAAQARPGQHLAATLADGRLEVRVLAAEAESGPT
jgi:exodeoxyribonuclease VII large subunit